MSKAPYEDRLDVRAELFQALGHPARLLIVNLVRMRPRHGQELAEILGLKPVTISHHLTKLAGAGLLQSRYQIYSLVPESLRSSLADLIHVPQVQLADDVQEDACRAQVLRALFRRGAPVRIPAQRKKRQIILEKIVESFEPDRAYAEKEVNQILAEFHEDVATLRREMIASRLMERQRGIYRRLPPPEGAGDPESQRRGSESPSPPAAAV